MILVKERELAIFVILFVVIFLILVCLDGSIADDERGMVIGVLVGVLLLYVVFVGLLIWCGYWDLAFLFIVAPAFVALVYLLYSGLNAIAAAS